MLAWAELTSQPNDAAARTTAASWRLRAAQSVNHWLRRNESDPAFAEAQTMLRTLTRSTIADYAVPAEHVALADDYARRGAAGTVAAMLLVPNWQWAQAPRLRDLPLWLMPVAADYLFRAPRSLTVRGQIEAYARLHLAALTDLAAMLQANRGSAAVRAALEHYQEHEHAPGLELAGAIAGDIRAARARLLTGLHRTVHASEPGFFSRTGRRLRVGILARELVSSAATQSLLPLVERLDAGRFELAWFTQQTTDSEIERQLMSRGGVPTPLSGDTDEMLQTLRQSNLDVAVFVFEGGWTAHPLAPLCLGRVAPVQLVHGVEGAPSFLPGADLYLTGAANRRVSAAGERAAVLPGLGLAGMGELTAAGGEAWTRAALELGESDVVCVAAAEPERVTLEVKEAWARVLDGVPQARLAIAAATPAGEAMDIFCRDLASLLVEKGIDVRRVSVFPGAELGTHQGRKNCLEAADLLLDFGGVGNGEMAFAALELGVPFVGCRNAATALLELAGRRELSGADEGRAAEIAVRLALEPSERETTCAWLRGAASACLAMHDSFVRSEVFGRLLENAFDAVAESRAQFARDRTPLQVEISSDGATLAEEARMFMELGAGVDAEARARSWLLREPASLEARGLLAKALGLQQRDDEAADVLVTLVELAPNDAALWHDLALAARQARRGAVAVQAVESALRLDPKRIESWFLVATLAEESGNRDMHREVLGVLKELAPGDSKVIALLAAAA